MARTFAAASSQYMSKASVPLTAAPLTIAGWVKPAAQVSGGLRIIAQLSHSGAGGGHVFDLRLETTGAVAAQTYDLTVNGLAITTALVTASVFQHVAAVFTSASSRSVFLSGTNKVTETSTSTPTGLDTTAIGAYVSTGASFFFDGDIGEIGIWNVALPDADIATLALGVSPFMVRPDALAFYVPLLGSYSPEIELVGRRDMTLSAGPVAAGHPRIFYPGGGSRGMLAGAAVSTVKGRMFLAF